MPAPLPDFVPPMLAKLGRRVFDSDEHLFELKWDGFRALAFVEPDRYWVRSRRKRDFTPRYPELACVRELAPGTVLDGEIVVMQDERPSFESMLKREQARDPRRIETLAARLPASFVVFDLLYQDGEELFDRPLAERKERLAELCAQCSDPRLVLSEGIVGHGTEFYAQAVAMGLEGVVAKRLDGCYLPGQRSELWTKFKATRRLHCLILGWLADETGDVRSLVVGADIEGELRCVGRVGSGLDESTRRRLRELLEAIPADEPLVECPVEGEWVEPGLYCTVSFNEFTSNGTLRAPVFEGLIEE